MYFTYYVHLVGIKEIIGERGYFETEKWGRQTAWEY
jgi:hypothetical protein